MRWPVKLGLLLHQTLGPRKVRDLGEAVGGAFVWDLGSIELTGEPFTPVDPDLQMEWELRLEPSVHEAKPRVNEVVVEVEALAPPDPHLSAPQLLASPQIEAEAGLDDSQDANGAGRDAIPFSNLTGDVLVSGTARLEVEDGAPFFNSALAGGFHHTRRHVADEVVEVGEINTAVFEKAGHAGCETEGAERAAKDQAIERVGGSLSLRNPSQVYRLIRAFPPPVLPHDHS